MKNTTWSADESLNESARRRAGAERTTLNERFRRRRAEYAGGAQTDRAKDVINRLRAKVRTAGQTFGREEMNERLALRLL